MTMLNRRTVIGLAVAAIIAAPATFAAKPAEPVDRIDAIAREAVAKGASPGLQVAVFKNGKPWLVRSYGMADLELKVPVDNDSVFRIGSLTKQFTAVALLKLQEEGRLSLDDRLSKYFPGFPHADGITLKQMLQHLSGIHNFTEIPGFLEKEALLAKTSAEMVAYLAAMPQIRDFEPGTSWRYSNSAYVMLGAIVAQVEGKPLGVVLRQRFFAPLGMTHTALDDETEIAPGRVRGYAPDGQGKFRNAGTYSMTIPGGAGGMRSSARDLALWNTALFGGKILAPASLAAMTSPAKLLNGQTSGSVIPATPNGKAEYGYGLVMSRVDTHSKVDHFGAIGGFSASLAQFPQDGITIAVLSNTIGPNVGAGDVTRKIERIALGLAPAE